MKCIDRPSVTAFSHKNYIYHEIKEDECGLVRESARKAEMVVLGPARIIYSCTKTGSVNGTVENCKRPDLFKGEIITQREFDKRIG